MKPHLIKAKLEQIKDELEAVEMTLTDELLNHNVDYIMLQLCLLESETCLNEAIMILEERTRRMN